MKSKIIKSILLFATVTILIQIFYTVTTSFCALYKGGIVFSEQLVSDSRFYL